MKQMSRRSLLAAASGAVAAGLVAGRAAADQPHMQAALDHLKEAREQLEKASPDKGGHRAKALDLTRRAILQVEEGIRFDRRH